MNTNSKQLIFGSLTISFLIYTFIIYSNGAPTDKGEHLIKGRSIQGKILFQEHNCIAFHQIYGLGGYMGNDLTNVISARSKGLDYAKAILQNGTQHMPKLYLSQDEIEQLVAFLIYVDKTEISLINKFNIYYDGTLLMQIFGYIMAILIGVSLGLIGAGGSILTVPILVYLFNVSPLLATSYSLFVVGVSAAVGSFTYMYKALFNYKIALIFGIPSLIGVFISRKLLLPNIPQVHFCLGNITFKKDSCILILFAILMIISAINMIKSTKVKRAETPEHLKNRYGLISLEGLLVGIIAGLVGIGGGFLIIPVLVIVAREPMKSAIGTSLIIIAINSLIGLLGDLSNHLEINWAFLGVFSSFALAGILIGTYLSKYISGAKLKPVFGWTLMVLGIYIIVNKVFYP